MDALQYYVDVLVSTDDAPHLAQCFDLIGLEEDFATDEFARVT